jgi:hypothetical protein
MKTASSAEAVCGCANPVKINSIITGTRSEINGVQRVKLIPASTRFR